MEHRLRTTLPKVITFLFGVNIALLSLLVFFTTVSVTEKVMDETAAATKTATATATLMLTPTPSPAPTLIPTSPAPPPLPIMGGNLDSLPVPDGLTTRYDGCSQTYGCKYEYNYYDANSREIVLQGGQSDKTQMHERCHAHQHWSINQGAPVDISKLDLSGWYQTSEGQDFMASVPVESWPWSEGLSTRKSSLEDFAESCAWWYTKPAELWNASPVRYNWMEAHLP